MKRRKGRHQETAPNEAKNRKYTSYEDEPFEEYVESVPAPTNLTKKFINVFLILFIAVAGALAFFYIDVLTPENISHWFHYELLGKTEGDGYPVRFDGISVNAENFSKELNDYCIQKDKDKEENEKKTSESINRKINKIVSESVKNILKEYGEGNRGQYMLGALAARKKQQGMEKGMTDNESGYNDVSRYAANKRKGTNAEKMKQNSFYNGFHSGKDSREYGYNYMKNLDK